MVDNKDTDITLDNQDTPADTLHGIAENKMQTPTTDWTSSDRDHIEKLAAHKNISGDTLHKLYNHIAQPNTDPGVKPGEEEFDYENLGNIKNILQSDKVPAAVAEDFINRTYKKDNNYGDFPKVLRAASKHPGVSRKFLEDKTNEAIDDPELNRAPRFSHHAGYLHGLLADRGFMEPEQGNMTDAQKANNRRVHKIDQVALEGLMDAKHTPEELDRSVDIFTSNAPNGIESHRFKNAAEGLINNQKDLKPEHLDKFDAAHQGDEDTDILKAIVKHPNVDPAYVTKMALGNQDYGDYWNGTPRTAALASPKLPETVRNKIIDDYVAGGQPKIVDGENILSHVLENKQLSGSDVAKIYGKFHNFPKMAKEAMTHENASPELAEDFYNRFPKNTENTNTMLKYGKTPPSVLKDIVGKAKNQDHAIEALNHKNADLSVVEAGLKRRAPAVQEAASRHPLVAHKVLRDKLKSGKMDASDILYNKKNKEAFGEITPEDVKTIDDNYKKTLPDDKGDPADFAQTKYWLSTDEKVPEDVRKRNKQELLQNYKSNIGKEDEKHLGDAVIQLVQEHGDEDAKKALLDSPGKILQHIDYSNKNLDSDFLDKAEAHLAKQYKDQNLPADRYESKLKPLAENPNASQNLFDKVTLTQNFLRDDISPKGASRYDQNRQNKTVFDQRYQNSTDQERHEGFTKLATMNNPYANEAILESRSAPNDIWNNTFNRQSDITQRDILRHSHSVDKLDDQNLEKNLMNGGENQRLVLGGLNPDKPSHVNLLNNLVSVPSSTGDNKRIADHIGRDFIESPQSNEVIDHALAVNPNLGVLLAKRKATIPYSNAGKIENLDRYLKTNATPEQYYDRWHSLLWAESPDKNEYGGGIKGMSRDGNMDFLANFPGDQQLGYEMRKRAMSLGLLSPAMTAKLTMEDPVAFEDSFKSMQGQTRKDSIANVLNSSNVDPHLINIVSKGIKPSDLYSGYIHRSDKVEIQQHVAKKIDQILDAQLKLAENKHPVSIGDTLGRLTDKTRNFSLSSAVSKQVIKSAVEKIQTSNLDQESKRSFLEDIRNNVDDKYLSSNLKSALAENLLGGSMADIVHEMMDSSPANLKKEFSNRLKKANTLPDEDIVSASKLFKNNSLSDKNKTKLLDQIVKRSKTNGELAYQTMSNVMDLTDNGGEIASKAIDHLLDMANTPNPERPENNAIAERALRGSFNRVDDVELKKKIFLKFPNEEGSLLLTFDSQTLPKELISDPEVLLASTHGWKLEAIIENADNLNANGADVITNRILAQPEHSRYNPNNVTSLAINLTRNKDSNPQNSVKLIRSLGPSGPMRFINKFTGRIGENEAAGLIAQHAVDSNDVDYGSLPHDAFFTAADTAMLNLYSINKFARCFDPKKNPTSFNKELLGKAQAKSLDLVKKLHNGVMARLETKDVDFKSQALSLAKHFGSFIDNLIDNDLSDLSSVDVIDMAHYGSDITEKVGDLAALEKSDELVSTRLSALLPNLSPKDHEWSEIFNKRPSIKYNLHDFNTITPAAIDSINFDAVLGSSDASVMLNSMSDWPQKIPKNQPELFKKLADLMLAHGSNGHRNSFFRLAFENHPKVFSAGQVQDVIDKTHDSSKVGMYVKAAENNAGGPDFALKAIDYVEQHSPVGDLSQIASKTNLTSEVAKKLLDVANGKVVGTGTKTTMLEMMSSNNTADESVVSHLYNYANTLEDQEAGGYKLKQRMFVNLVAHPNIGFGDYKKIYESTQKGSNIFLPGQKFNRAFLNRKHGGQLLRSLPVEIPSEFKDTVNKEALPKKFEYSKAKERLNEALKSIPPEGMDWGSFKKANPKASNWPEVKQIFMQGKGQKATPEDMVAAQKDLGGDYHLTFSMWDGAQRHSNANNLVVQLNTGENMENQLKADPKLFAFFQKIQIAANRTAQGNVGGHPVTPICASWVRVDTSGGKAGWIVEETQSDFSASLSQQLELLHTQHPDGLTLDGEHFTPDEMVKYAKSVERVISDWHTASIKGMSEMAKAQGVENLYLHGADVRATLSGFDDRNQGYPVYIDYMYSRYPKANGWESVDYTDYPNQSSGFKDRVKKAGRSTQCWKLKLK